MTAFALWLLIAVTGLWIGHAQPWLGLTLRSQGEQVTVAAIGPAGPASGLLRPGDILASVGRPGGDSLRLSPLDLTPEPTYFHRYTTQNAFLERQQRLAAILRSPRVEITLADGRRIELQPAQQRPWNAFPASFWIQLTLLHGLAFALAAAVLRRRPSDVAARYYALSALGAACLVCTYAIYSTRELALPADLFRGLLAINNGGGLILVIGSSTSLIWNYPKALGKTPLPLIAHLLTTGFAIAHESQWFPSIDLGLRLPCVLGFAAQSTIAVCQWRRARGRPAQRAMLKWLFIPWFGCSWLYVLLFFLSPLAGLAPQAPQWLGWLLLLSVFVGYAFGLTRFRLYYLNPANALLWLAGGAVVVALVSVQTAVLGVNPLFATCLALTLAGSSYGALQQRLLGAQRLRHAGFERVLRLVLERLSACRDPQQVEQAWLSTLRVLFEPRSIDADLVPEGAVISEADGERLRVTATYGDHGRASGWRLHYAYGGRGLFTPQDITLVAHLWRIFHAMSVYWSEHLQGQARERRHLAVALRDLVEQDLARLIAEAKRPPLQRLARAAQDELRQIMLVAIGGGEGDLQRWLTHSCADTEERCRAAGMRCHWRIEGHLASDIDAERLAALDGVLCEAITNVIRHSAASNVWVTLGADGEGRLRLVIEDDGVGPAAKVGTGYGFGNMRQRAAAVGGSLTVGRAAESGVRLTLRLPLPRSGDAAIAAGDVR